MALGNNAGKGSARRKGQTAIRIKERRTAKNYNSVTSSPVQSRSACGYSGSMSETFYHNSGSTVPGVGDIIYLKKRARSDNKFGAGHYKITADGRTNFSIQVDTDGVVRAKTSCR